MSNRKVLKSEKSITLTDKEFNFLAHLVRHKGQVCSRQSIIEEVMIGE
jgi:DNA-binding response OmpR family regulator